MTRFAEDGDYDEEYPNEGALWAANRDRAIKGRKGQAFLRALKAALEALPEKRLIGDAVCTIGADARVAELRAKAEAKHEEWPAEDRRRYALMTGHTPQPDYEKADNLAELVAHDGEGVCLNGAFAWHQLVTKGTDPVEAFRQLPTGADGDKDTVAVVQKHARVIDAHLIEV